LKKVQKGRAFQAEKKGAALRKGHVRRRNPEIKNFGGARCASAGALGKVLEEAILENSSRQKLPKGKKYS